MGLPRSTYYDAPAVKADDGEIVAAMTTICDEFEALAIVALAPSFAVEGWW